MKSDDNVEKLIYRESLFILIKSEFQSFREITHHNCFLSAFQIISSKMNIKCHLCSEVFYNKNNLRRHLIELEQLDIRVVKVVLARIEDTKFECECGFTF